MTSQNTLLQPTPFTHSNIDSPSSPELAAVAYLNMLPFFCEKTHFTLFASPQALNAKHSNFDAYCSSLIAGLEAGKTPITLKHGIFSKGSVMSVFIEPVLHQDSHFVFWNQLQQLWMHCHPNPVEAIQQHECHGTILLRSSGESAHSVWMFQVLCAMAGFDVKVLNEAEKCIAPHTERLWPEARLYIGDEALLRLKNSPQVLRLDLSESWNKHTGHRAWFAGWFEGRSSSQQTQEKIEKILSLQINSWTESSEFARWCKCFAFLESQNKHSSGTDKNDDLTQLRELLSDYFNHIEHEIDVEEGRELLDFYRKLQGAYAAWQHKRSTELSPPADTSTSNRSHVQPHSAST